MKHEYKLDMYSLEVLGDVELFNAIIKKDPLIFTFMRYV